MMDLLQTLRRDHAEFGAALNALEGINARLENRYFRKEEAGLDAALEASEILGRLLPRLERHERLERRFLFAELARWSAEFVPIVRRMETEHEEVDRQIARLLDLLPDIAREPGAVLERELEHLITRIRKHMFLEEIEVYPMAEDSIPKERLEQLSTRAEAERLGANDPLES